MHILFSFWIRHCFPSSSLPVQRTRTKFLELAFSVVGPSVWNSPPADLRLEPDTAVFKRKLKNYLFVVFLLSSFLRFNVTIVIRYCTFSYIVISVY